VRDHGRFPVAAQAGFTGLDAPRTAPEACPPPHHAHPRSPRGEPRGPGEHAPRLRARPPAGRRRGGAGHAALRHRGGGGLPRRDAGAAHRPFRRGARHALVRAPHAGGACRGWLGPIPLLSQVLDRLPRTAWINVELKAERWGDTGVAEAAGTLLEAGGHSDHVVVSSFHPLCLPRLALRFPGLRRALLLDPHPPMARPTGLCLPLLARDAVHPEAGHFDRVDVDRWHRGGREVAAWTIDDPAVARRFREWGVDSCITNRPGLLRSALA